MVSVYLLPLVIVQVHTRNTLRSDETANDKDKEIIEEGEAERDLQPTRDMEKAKVGHAC